MGIGVGQHFDLTAISACHHTLIGSDFDIDALVGVFSEGVLAISYRRLEWQ